MPNRNESEANTDRLLRRLAQGTLTPEERRKLEEARKKGAYAGERLFSGGSAGDIVILALSGKGKIHVKDYIRAAPNGD